jgi:branched-subunit amino acid aminotransferase/4-amino-4-deoxychorismate lyase
VIDELGLFETMRVVRGRVVEAEEHLERMLASTHALSFPSPDPRAFRRAVGKAAQQAAQLDEAALRCVYAAPHGDDWRLTATTSPAPPITLRRRRRGRAITLAHARALPEHKLTAYAASTIGLREAVAKNADEGLFLDRYGHVLEGTATNVFAIGEETLITAPLDAGILPGIVRGWVIANASHVGLRVVERAPTIDELRAGSFFTSSLTTLAPIRRIDGTECAAPARGFAGLRRLYLKR